MNSEIVSGNLILAADRRVGANATVVNVLANTTAVLYSDISANVAYPLLADLVQANFPGYSPRANLVWNGPKLTGGLENASYVADTTLSWIANATANSAMPVVGVAVVNSANVVISMRPLSQPKLVTLKDDDVTVLYELDI